MATQVKLAVIGGGISGLTAAYRLKERTLSAGPDLEVHLFERSDRLGGVIQTETGGDLLLERGAEAFLSAKSAARELVEKLGLQEELVGSREENRKTYVLHQGRLHPTPDGLAFLAPVRFRSFWSNSLISTRGKLRALLEPVVPRTRGEPTARAFLERRLGREMTEKLGEPLVSAIYGGDVDRLSAVSALSGLFDLEQRHGSLWKGLRAAAAGAPSGLPLFCTFRSGMGRLIARLAEELQEFPGVRLHLGVQDLRLIPAAPGYRLRAPGIDEHYRGLVLATPAPACADLLDGVSPEAAGLLRQIPYTSTTLVYLAYRRREFSHPLNGYGFVVPKAEAEVLDACTWASSKFPGRCPEDRVLLRCALHDGRRVRAEASPEELVERVHRELARILEIQAVPVFSRVWELGPAMPQMTPGHSRRLQEIQSASNRHPGLFLTGAFTGGVGIPDCIDGAGRTAAQVLAWLEAAPEETVNSAQRPSVAEGAS